VTTDLAELARRFPTDFVERKDGSDYVAHHVVNQRLLSIVGPFDFELVEVIRGDLPAVAPDPSKNSKRGKAGVPALHQAIVGGIWRLTCMVDGRRVRVEEVGDCQDPHNWNHDGARLKDAASDAIKRCAMRLGLGLHLWAQEHYFLDVQLAALTSRPTVNDTEVQDSLAPRSAIDALLRQHGRTWEQLRDIMQARDPEHADRITVESLKAATMPSQVAAIRSALEDHAGSETAA
jgi:hypothetical protein